MAVGELGRFEAIDVMYQFRESLILLISIYERFSMLKSSNGTHQTIERVTVMHHTTVKPRM